jgi:hypothetical protein
MPNVPFHIAAEVVLLIFNGLITFISLKIHAEVSDLKSYMHEKFLSKDDFKTFSGGTRK